jgi:RND family efflux transporter MFP subunit
MAMMNMTRLVWIIAAALSLAACGDAEIQEPAVASDYPRLVKTLVLGAAELGDIVLPGQVAASEKVDLAFQVEGPLVELPVLEGEQVHEGQLLARIDPRDYQNSLAEAQAELEAVGSQYRRYERLINSRNSPITRAEFDTKKSDFEVAQAKVAQGQKDLEDTELKAPFNGTVAVRHVENFEFVQAKEHILRLVDTTQVEIIVDVPEGLMGRGNAKVGDEMGGVVIAASPGESYPVRLKEFSTTADASTQTYKVTLVMVRPKHLNVLPGMTATFVRKAAVAEDATVFFIPVPAVVGDEKNAHAWVVDSVDMTVTKRNVTLGKRVGQRVEVTGGLTAGERIVAAGADLLEDGMKVRLYEAGMLGT